MKTIFGLVLALVLSAHLLATPTPVPSATPTFVTGINTVYEALPVTTVTLPVPQTQDFTLGFQPAGQLNVTILDLDLNKWITFGDLTFTSPALVNAVADINPNLMAYTILEPVTLRLRFGSRCSVFAPNHRYQIYVSYPTLWP